MRIAVMGYSGAGKSCLTARLSHKTGIPALHLDDVKYDKSWQPIDNEVVLPKVQAFMDRDDWIIDGNYAYLLQAERLERADCIVFVTRPRLVCLGQAVLRSRERKKAGYQNDMNLWFIQFVLHECRNKKRCAHYKAIMEKYRDKTVVLKNRRQTEAFLAGI